MRIGVYINNANISTVDCSKLSDGNPGIGGTQYAMLLFADAYRESYNDDFVITYLDDTMQLSRDTQSVVVNSLSDLAGRVVADRIDILVLSTFQPNGAITSEDLEIFNSLNIRVVTWGHNNYKSEVCKTLTNAPCVRANVFVGRQQYDRYIDTDLIRKSIVIYNLYPVTSAKDQQRASIFSNQVTYIGSLIPAKGFHILADSWKKIVEEVPDAKLNVIGGGNLYDSSAILGSAGITEKNYEKRILKHLRDHDGNILPSVHFWGVLGNEKNSIISSTSVGVVNPTGRTETFGISAVDFESRGVPVVTIARGGFLDTVRSNETGLLFARHSELSAAVIRLLKNPIQNQYLGKNAREFVAIFSTQVILPQWHRLFIDVLNQNEMPVEQHFDHIGSQLKWLRIVNSKVRRIPGFSFIPAIIDVESMVFRLKNVLGHLRRRD